MHGQLFRMQCLLLMVTFFQLLLVQPRHLGKRFELDRLDEYLAGALRIAKLDRWNERGCATAARKPERAVTGLLLRFAAPYAQNRAATFRLPSSARLSEYVEEEDREVEPEGEEDDDEYWASLPEISKNISVSEAWAMLQESEEGESKPVLLDLRSRRLHCIQRPAGALSQTAGLSGRLGLTFQFDENFVDDVGRRFGLDQPLLLFHRLSRNGAELLERAGHTAVYAIDGGLGAWKKSGLPVDRGVPDDLAWEGFDPESEELYLDQLQASHEEHEEDDEVADGGEELLLGFDSLDSKEEHPQEEEEEEEEGELEYDDEVRMEDEASLSEEEEEEDFDSLTVPILKDKLRALGLKVSGNKADLVDRLRQAKA